MERRRIIMLGVTIAIAAWLLADLLLPMTGLVSSGAGEGPLVGIATRNLPAGHRVKVEDVEPIAATAESKEPAGLKETRDADAAKEPADRTTNADAKSRTPAAVGRVLARSVTAGERIHAKDLIPRSTGELIARQLQPGYRAVTVTLRDSMATIALYPGAMVDVLATMDVPTGNGTQRETLTSTVIERAKVLAVNDETIYKVRTESVPGERHNAPRKPTVTLALTPEQAAQVELAGNKGTIGLALRSELDPSASLDATATARRPGQPAGAPEPPKVEPRKVEPPKVTATAKPAPTPVAPSKPATWDVVILRGKDSERVPFPAAPAPDPGSTPKAP